MTPPVPRLSFGDLCLHQRKRVLGISRDAVVDRAFPYEEGRRVTYASYRYLEDSSGGIPEDSLTFRILCVVLQLEPLKVLEELGYLSDLPAPLS